MSKITYYDLLYFCDKLQTNLLRYLSAGLDYPDGKMKKLFKSCSSVELKLIEKLQLETSDPILIDRNQDG